MPIYEIEHEGKTYEVDAATPEEASRAFAAPSVAGKSPTQKSLLEAFTTPGVPYAGITPTPEIGGQQLRGYGKAPKRILQNTLRLLTPDSLTPDWASTERMQAEDAAMSSSERTTRDLGAQALTAALPGGVLGKLPQGVRGLRAASAALRSPVGQGAVYGAAGSGLTAAPGQENEAAASGALAGGALGGALAGGGRLLSGAVQRSPDTELLQTYAREHGDEIFVPVAQAADSQGDATTRAGKFLYKSMLPAIPFVSDINEAQRLTGLAKARKFAARESDVYGVVTPDTSTADDAILLKNSHTAGYDKILNKANVKLISPNNRDAIVAAMRAADPKLNNVSAEKFATIVQQELEQFSNGERYIDASQLWKARNVINDKLGDEAGKIKSWDVARGVTEFLDNHLEKGLQQISPASYKEFMQLRDAYGSKKAFTDAVDAAMSGKGGDFTFSQLARTSKGLSPTLNDLANTTNVTLGSGSVNANTAGRIAAYGTLMGLGAGGGLTPVALGGATALGLSTKPVQKAVLGDFEVQRKLAEWLRKDPELLQSLTNRANALIQSE